jgi:hypothetical protein
MGSFWKEAWEGSGRGEFLVLWFLVLQRDLGGPSLSDRGVEDVEKKTREEEEEGRAGGRQEKVRSFW